MHEADELACLHNAITALSGRDKLCAQKQRGCCPTFAKVGAAEMVCIVCAKTHTFPYAANQACGVVGQIVPE